MKVIRTIWSVGLVGALGTAALASAASADPIADFYKGKRISVIVGSSPGSKPSANLRATHDARTCTLVPDKSVALSASACQVSMH